MPDVLTVLHVVGARPNFMKIAPVLRALEGRDGVRNVLVHTGQHYDAAMSDSFFASLGIRDPDVHLGVGSGSHAQQTAAVLVGMEEVLERERPDLLMVVGDVNSTLAAALAASKLHVPVAHLEAGLRSRDRAMPEEINRVLTDQIADLCLTPSRDGDANLLAEGVAAERICFVGNVMIDTLLRAVDELPDDPPDALDGVAGPYALVTLHRPSNVDDPNVLGEIVGALDHIAEEMPVLFPVHPRTRARLGDFGLEPGPRVRLLEPLGYHDMLALQRGATVVLTDSGGIQEETTVLGVPCLTLRSSTERPITVTEGTNRLVPSRTHADIVQAFQEVRGGSTRARRPEGWDGRAAERVADAVEAWAAARESGVDLSSPIGAVPRG